MRTYVQGPSQLDRLLMKSVVGKDGGVPRRGPDTSVTVRCTKCDPHAEFVAIADRTAEDNLARHVADKHTRKPPKMLTPAETAADRERAIDAVMDRIINGSLKPGRTISVTSLAEELGVSRYTMQQAMAQLIEVEMLRWVEVGSGVHRRVMVCPQ